MDTVGKRLQHIRGANTQIAFAKKLNVHRNTLGKYEQDELHVSGEVLKGVWEMGWNPIWLLTGNGDEQGQTSSPLHIKSNIHESDFIRVKRYRLRLAAGAGQIGDENEEVDWLSFRRQYLEFIGLSAKNAAIVRIKGDSMEPMMIDGDTVMIDLSDHRPAVTQLR